MPDRNKLVEAIQQRQRHISGRTVLFHQLIGERVGLGPTDLKSLDYTSGKPDAPITAGLLAELTGLTTGAITGVLDRLERAGFIRREKDPEDRRQVRIVPVAAKLDEVGRYFEPLTAAWNAVSEKFSDAELAIIVRFLDAAYDMLGGEIDRMKTETESPAGEGSAVPIGNVKRGELLITSARKLTITATDDPVLYRSVWTGPPPRSKVDGGEGTVRADGQGGRLALSSAIPWNVRFRGSAIALDADLRRIDLRSLELSGGARDVHFRLGPPQGVVPVEIRGGASKLSILRPPGTPAALEVRGGASGVTLEGLRLGDVGGQLRWATPDSAGAKERYDIEVTGGVSTLTVGVG